VVGHLVPELRRDGMAVRAAQPACIPDRGRRAARTSRGCSASGRPARSSPATDYIRQLPDMIRPWVDRPYTVLGTDGYGRSDYRKALRRFFEVDRHHVVVAALEALGRPEDAAKAIAQYEIDPDREAPWRT
jgi:pyruvate dehydrogenase E1 component